MKASQKAAVMLKRAAQAAIKFAKVTIKATVEAVKATIAILKATIALIIAGGWIAVVIILIVCVAAVVGGMLIGESRMVALRLYHKGISGYQSFLLLMLSNLYSII